jgi:5'-3' exonuclease
MVDSLLFALHTVQNEYPDHRLLPVLLWAGRAQWRYDLYPDYKQRSVDPDHLAMKEAFRQQVPVLRGLWHRLGMPQIIAVDEEADDVAGHLAPRVARHGPVTAISKDGDWLQIVGPNVRLYVHGENARWVGEADLPTAGGKFGYQSPAAFIQAKALAGDVSDNISGVDGVGLHTAAKLLAEFGSVERFWSAVDRGEHTAKGVIQQRLASAETRAMFHRNCQLMDWTQSPPLQPTTFLWIDRPDRAEALAILRELELKQAAGRLAEFVPSFDYHSALSAHQHPLQQALAAAQYSELEEAA